MADPDWMTGFRQELPKPLGWRPGQTSMEITVICCPQCASPQVRPRNNIKAENTMRWECSVCGAAFRLPISSPIKAYING
jgi:rubredoxin